MSGGRESNGFTDSLAKQGVDRSCNLVALTMQFVVVLHGVGSFFFVFLLGILLLHLLPFPSMVAFGISVFL
jgi:hypothetical protein